MRAALVILLKFLIIYISTVIVDSSEVRIQQSINGEDFLERLKKGYNLLKNEPNAYVTMRFLKQLHSIDKEITNELFSPPKHNANLLDMMKNYIGSRSDLILPMGDTIEEINRKSNVDTALFQGDMMLTKEQSNEIMEDIIENEESRKKRQAFRDQTYPNRLWSKGVHYSFDPSTTNQARRTFRRAALLWSWDTCINFGESNLAANRINVIRASGCWSYIGRHGGVQSLSLGQRCDSVGIAAHEIGHALGFFHTQTRHDRDKFITVYGQNILPSWSNQFIKQTERTNYNYNLTYDYGSVMHYGATSVSKNGQPVMVPHDVKYLQTLGSQIISFYEKLMINLHYGCLDKCKRRPSATCENGGFTHPRDCTKCICPSGYGGILCSERPNGCGSTLEATAFFQTFKDTVRARKKSNDFTMCNYWIQAPNGSTIEVVLESFTAVKPSNGCPYAGVEIKSGKDKRHTGYRFCSVENFGTSLVSTYNIVPVITYSRLYETTTVLRYRIASLDPNISTTTSRTTRHTISQSTNSPKAHCQDSHVCTTLMKWNFCHSSKYDEDLRRLVCPASCGLC